VLDRLLAFLPEHPRATSDTVGGPFAQRELAVAILLLELAQADRRLRGTERHAIDEVLAARFGLDAEGVSRLVAAAETMLGAALEDWVFARIVRESFAPAEREQVFAMLWEVVYADGKLARLEGDLMDHLARELDISRQVSETTRLKALARATARAGGAAEEGQSCEP
jgi:uncharacterized tellurite resistance protein B-like protein